MLINKVQQTIDRYKLLEIGSRILVAVSGGVDSVVMLDVLCSLASSRNLELVIAHVDHCLREDSADDAEFVRELANEYGLEIRHTTIDIKEVSRKEGMGLEEAGRKARRRFLLDTISDIGAGSIATGHTRNDQAETLVLNLARGAGMRGLRSIQPTNELFIRPLIDCTRDEVLRYARRQRLEWREDSTNIDTTFSRNWVRQKVLPLLSEQNPNIVDALSRTADLSREQEKALDYLLEKHWATILLREEEAGVLLDSDCLRGYPQAVQALVLRRGIVRSRGSLAEIEKVHVDSLVRLIASNRTHGEIDLPGLSVRVDGNGLRMSVAPKDRVSEFDAVVDLGQTNVPELGISLRLYKEEWDSSRDSLPQEKMVEIADLGQVCYPLRLRVRKPGDKFRPLGMKGTKKIKDLLIDEKIPYYDRNRIPLLCDAEKIIWVVGLRLSEDVSITDRTRKVLVMQAEEIQ